jgi:hypothetical protein
MTYDPKQYERYFLINTKEAIKSNVLNASFTFPQGSSVVEHLGDGIVLCAYAVDATTNGEAAERIAHLEYQNKAFQDKIRRMNKMATENAGIFAGAGYGEEEFDDEEGAATQAEMTEKALRRREENQRYFESLQESEDYPNVFEKEPRQFDEEDVKIEKLNRIAYANDSTALQTLLEQAHSDLENYRERLDEKDRIIARYVHDLNEMRVTFQQYNAGNATSSSSFEGSDA